MKPKYIQCLITVSMMVGMRQFLFLVFVLCDFNEQFNLFLKPHFYSSIQFSLCCNFFFGVWLLS